MQWPVSDSFTHSTSRKVVHRQIIRGHDKLQELEGKLSRTLLQSRDLCNTFYSEDGALPDDVLFLVLEQACVVLAEPTIFSSSSARVLSGVCKRWRSLLLSNPFVWSDVRITISRPGNLSWLDTCLTRSASCPAGCTIRVDRPVGTRPGAEIITKVISRHPSNIRTLQINPRIKEDYDVLTLNMEKLERLYIDAGKFDHPPLPTASHLTKLRDVTLRRLPTIPHDVFFNIRQLSLCNIISPINNLVDILQANQTLERIQISDTVVTADSQGRLISLPNLKLLIVSHASSIVVLRTLMPLPTPSRLIVLDNIATLVLPEISDLFNPFLIFGSNDSVLTASISILLEKVSIDFRTSMGATVEIITLPTLLGPGHLEEFPLLLQAVSQWGPFPNLRSMHLHIEPNATGPIDTAVVRGLLSRAPRVTRLTFKGHTLCFHICQALHTISGGICPELEYLGGTLYPDDHITDRLRSLSEALEGRPTVQEVALDALFPEGEIERTLAETGPLIEEIKSDCTYGFSLSFTSTTDED